MAILIDVNVNDLIDALAEELKKIKDIKPPEWAVYAKTGMSKERPPMREDWWHVRAAAVLKAVEKLGPVGVSKLRTKYGSKKNRGHKPDKFYRGSGNILRKALQQLEKAGLIKKQEKGVHKGRVITPAGKKLIRAALKEAPAVAAKKEAARKAREEKRLAEQKAARPEPRKDVNVQKQEQARPEMKAQKPAEKVEKAPQAGVQAEKKNG